jgi:hypothetical protein
MGNRAIGQLGKEPKTKLGIKPKTKSSTTYLVTEC